MKKTYAPFLATLIMTSLLGSCGKDDSSRSPGSLSSQAEDAPAAVAEDFQGSYIAKFNTLNPHVVGTIPGASHIRREGNQIYAFVRLFAGSPSIPHFQNIHTGNRCPTIADDTNGDGFIDYQEAIAVVGPILIPLDWDISTQSSGNRSWPKAFENGSYEYLKIANFNRFLSDLQDTDKNPNDNIVKLAPNEPFTLTGKVVLIQGVGEDKMLPDTVAGNGRYRSNQTLPIVCGIFAPNSEQPGVPYEEGIPGPVADAEDFQDVPAPEGAGEIAGTGTVIEGPSNEAGSNDSGSEGHSDSRTETSTPSTSEAPRTEPASENEDDGGFRWPWER